MPETAEAALRLAIYARVSTEEQRELIRVLEKVRAHLDAIGS